MPCCTACLGAAEAPSGSRALSAFPSRKALLLLDDESNWSRRLLHAGGWLALNRCLATLPGSSQLQQVRACLRACLQARVAGEDGWR